MTTQMKTTQEITWIAIDIAKKWNIVLVEEPDGKQRHFKVANTKSDHDRFVAFLDQQPNLCKIAMEPTGDYHRPLGYRLLTAGLEVVFVSSLAVARVREALFNSWDKNDRKDAMVILHLLKQGQTQFYHEPLLCGIQDIQELSKTYTQIALARTRLYHSIQCHYLPLYWPEFQRYWHTSRADWVATFLGEFPIPAAVREHDCHTFVQKAWSLIGRKVNKRAWLEELYEMAGHTIGLPVCPDSIAIQTFQMQLVRYQSLLNLRDEVEALAEQNLQSNPDFILLKSIPGIGSILAMVIIAEAGDLRRFGHHRQFLKYCGLDLSKKQSGKTQGPAHLSKRGNAQLRYAFWFAGRVAVRMRENSFRSKYERYIQSDPTSRDRKRKALTAVAAKMARVAYAVVKTGKPYQAYFESAVPSGSIPLKRAVEVV